MDTLTTIIANFKGAFTIGVANIKPMALGLYWSLLTIDFTWAAIQAVLKDGGSLLKTGVTKIVRYGIFLYFIKNYETVFHQVLDSLIKVGLTAGGNTISADLLADPSWLITQGFAVVDPIKNVILAGGTVAFGGLALVFAYFFIILAFFIIAIQVFVAYIEAYVIGTLAIIFLGCGVNKHTTFLAEKTIGAVLSMSIKLMTIGFIISISEPLLMKASIAFTIKDILESSLKLLASAMAIAFLCWQAPSLAAGMMAGAPSLSAGAVAGAMAAGAALAGTAMTAGAGAAAAIGGGLASGAGAAANATMQAANAGLGLSDKVMNTSLSEFGGGSSGGAGGGGMTAESVAAKMTGGGGGSTGGGTGAAAGGTASGGGDTGASGAAESAPAGADSSSADTGGASGATGSSDTGTGGASTGGGGGSSTTPQSGGGGTNGSGGSGGGGDGGGGSAGTSAQSTGASEVSSSQAQAAAGDGNKQSSGITYEGIANRLSQTSNMIPPEASPQGGVGARISSDND